MASLELMLEVREHSFEEITRALPWVALVPKLMRHLAMQRVIQALESLLTELTQSQASS